MSRADRAGRAAFTLRLLLVPISALAMVAAMRPASARQASGSEAQQRAMDAVARPEASPGSVVADPETVKKITTRVLCMCGGCVNQTLDECTCGTAAQEREKVAAALASGKMPDAIIKEYVDEFGLQIMSTPDKKGFNLVGWLVPFAVAIVLLAALTFILRGWVRPAPIEAADPTAPLSASPRPALDPVEARYRERLEQELRDFKA